MWEYLKSREFWLTILGLIVLAVLMYVLLFLVFLPSYTRHGEFVQVPDVASEKMSIEEARQIIEAEGLQVVVAESLYIAGMEPRAVISQDPVGYRDVKPGRKIYLTVNKVNPPMVRFPDILNVSNYQAKLRLESWNLRIGDIEYRPHPYRNLVLGAKVKGKKIAAGDSIPVGTAIDLIVGQGKGSTNIEMPKLVGLPYQNAISVMHQLGLNIGSIKFDPESDEPDGLVINQYPKFIPNDSIRLGEQISLFISGEQPDETIEGLLEGYIDMDEDQLDSLKKLAPASNGTSDEDVDIRSGRNDVPEDGF